MRTTRKLGTPLTPAFASKLSGITVCMSKSPLVGCVQNTSLSQLICSPQVLPPLEEYCSNAEPSGLKRTTPEPTPPKSFEPSPLFTLLVPL